MSTRVMSHLGGGALIVCLAVVALAPAPAGASPPTPTITFVQRAGPGATFEQVTFFWSSCGNCDFYQVRWDGLGDGEFQNKLDGAGTTSYRTSVSWKQPGAVYVFKVQACDGGMFGSDCSGWAQTSVTVPAPPSGLQASDASRWTGPTTFVGKVHLHWDAGVGLAGIKVRRGASYDLMRLPGDATDADLDLVPGGSGQYRVCGYLMPDRGKEYQVGCTDLVSVQLALPSPKAPTNVRASLVGGEEVRVSFTGDNIAQTFEVERMQLPPVGAEAVGHLPQGLAGQAATPQTGRALRPGSVPGPAPLSGAAGSPLTARSFQPAPPAPHWMRLPPQNMKDLLDPGHNYTYDDRMKDSSGPLMGSPYVPYTYRVCAVSTKGRACSNSVVAQGGKPLPAGVPRLLK